MTKQLLDWTGKLWRGFAGSVWEILEAGKAIFRLFALLPRLIARKAES
jgi:hypothetical protein